MLSRQKQARTVLKRYSHVASRSNDYRSYSSKVRAIPFAISREEAIDRLSWNTAVYTGNKFAGTLLRRFIPSLDVDALRPTRLQATYLPTWVVDAEVLATAWLKKQESDSEFLKDSTQVQFAHTVMPGFIYAPLSNLNLMTSEYADNNATIPWSDDLRKHDGEDVLCLPFSLSPFKLPEAARSMSLSDATISQSFRFDPSSLETSTMTAYPILVPVYLAQFTVDTLVDGQMRTVTASSFMEAGRKNGRIFIEVVEALRYICELLGMIPVPNLIIRGGGLLKEADQFANVRPVIGRHSIDLHRRQLRRWADTALASVGWLRRYRDQHFGKTELDGARAVDWEDVRIRPFVDEERWANLEWLRSGEDLFLLKTMLQVYSSQQASVDAQQPQPEDSSTASESAPANEFEKVAKQINELEKMREGKKPAWLSQYELQQRLLADYSATTPTPTPTPTPATTVDAGTAQ